MAGIGTKTDTKTETGSRSRAISTDIDDFADRGREVAVKCWFTAKGEPMPMMLKVQVADDIVTVRDIVVISAESQKEFSAVNWTFHCQAEVGGRLRRFFLRFFSKDCRWKLLA